MDYHPSFHRSLPSSHEGQLYLDGGTSNFMQDYPVVAVEQRSPHACPPPTQLPTSWKHQYTYQRPQEDMISLKEHAFQVQVQQQQALAQQDQGYRKYLVEQYKRNEAKLTKGLEEQKRHYDKLLEAQKWHMRTQANEQFDARWRQYEEIIARQQKGQATLTSSLETLNKAYKKDFIKVSVAMAKKEEEFQKILAAQRDAYEELEVHKDTCEKTIQGQRHLMDAMFNRGNEFQIEKEQEMRAHEEFHERKLQDLKRNIGFLASANETYKRSYQMQIEKCSQVEEEKEIIEQEVADLREALSEQIKANEFSANYYCDDDSILPLQKNLEEEEEDQFWDKMEHFFLHLDDKPTLPENTYKPQEVVISSHHKEEISQTKIISQEFESIKDSSKSSISHGCPLRHLTRMEVVKGVQIMPASQYDFPSEVEVENELDQLVFSIGQVGKGSLLLAISPQNDDVSSQLDQVSEILINQIFVRQVILHVSYIHLLIAFQKHVDCCNLRRMGSYFSQPVNGFV